MAIAERNGLYPGDSLILDVSPSFRTQDIRLLQQLLYDLWGRKQVDRFFERLEKSRVGKKPSTIASVSSSTNLRKT